MPNWLEIEFKKIINKEVPFVRRGTFYWMEALAFEIKAEYYTGDDLDKAKITNVVQNPGVVQNPADISPYVFTSLYMSKNYLEFLKNAKDELSGNAYNYPTSIVSWYYLMYNSIHAILSTYGGQHLKTHSDTIRCLNANNIGRILPYPFNVFLKKSVANHAYKYQAQNAKMSDADFITGSLNVPLNNQRINAQSRIHAYLHGTADYEKEKIEDRLRNKMHYPNFLTHAAKDDRNSKMKDINFLNCAFRYRGKVNYRDAICLSYKNVSEGESLINDLLVVGEFLYEYTLEFLKLRMGGSFVTDYLSDVGN